MWRIVTFKKISYFILISIVTSILLFYSKQTNSQIAIRGCRQESSRACWWLRKQELNENIARVCKKYGNFRDRISESSLVNRINFLHHGNMVNCIIQKAASTTWIGEFLRLESNTSRIGDRIGVKENLSVKEKMFENILYDPKLPLVVFSTVRHPLERVVSAYRNKFEEKDEEGKFVQRFGDLTFPQFVHKIIDENEMYSQTDISKAHNVHWKPFYLSHCGFCEVPFTVIAKAEELNTDMKFIGQMASVSFASLVKNRSKGQKSTQDYLALLDERTLKELIKVYQIDFEMFQYSPDII